MKNKPLIVVLVLVLFAGLLSVGSYNGLVNKEENVNASYSNVQSQLQMRFDKINQLVAVVQTNLDHESEVYKSVAALRTGTPGVSTDANGKLVIDNDLTLAQMENIETQLNDITAQFNVAVEAYPQLNNQLSVGLMDEISSTESQLNQARRAYNNDVTAYNRSLRTFPSSIFANMFGFEKAELFKASDDAQGAPNKLGD